MFYTVLQLIIPLYLLWYGARLKFKTPEFGDSKHGISSWRTREDKVEWEAGNKFGGMLCMIYAVILAVICTVKHLIWGNEVITAFNYIFAAVTFICFFSLVPLIHAMLTKRFGKKEFKSDSLGLKQQMNPNAAKSSGKKHKKK